jgi:hypothetical protein
MNVASVSWTDHLTFGEGDGRLDIPEKVSRRFRAWRDELGAGAVHWRLLRARIPGRFFAAPGYEHPSQAAAKAVTWDDLREVPALAHDAGLEAWLYVSLFDEGWPLAPPDVRARSFHNEMHGQHIAWQSDLTREHPEWLAVDRSGTVRQHGVVSLAHPEARRAFVERWLGLLHGAAFDGLFVCLRSQSKPAEHADQFGLDGDDLTALLVELRGALARDGRRLGVGAARGDVIGPPLGNATLAWREWISRGLVDDLVINQSSSQCPSMWHQLWPMHRGTGYRQNHLDGTGMPPLLEHVRTQYSPAVEGSRTRLFIARQWSERSDVTERELRAIPGVTGLVFSTFRHDNPAAIARGDWRAGEISARE